MSIGGKLMQACMGRTTLPLLGCAILALLTTGKSLQAQDPKSNLIPLGGNWFLDKSESPKYLYDDAGRMQDLFSYHQLDSNKDGIANLRISHDRDHLIIESQGYPNHPTAKFPNSGNPNSIKVQDFTFRFPLTPKLSGKVTRVPMGPIGMASNGVVFFNPFEIGGMNAVAGYSEVWLDSCCGHPQQTGVYHYHKYPSCVKSPFADDGKQHSPIIGFAFDGFPIYGPYESEDTFAKDLEGENALDVCNGHSDPLRGYHYHVTPGRFPYVLGGYSGIVEESNNRGLARAREGAISDNSEGESRLPQVIGNVVPGSATPGTRIQISIELLPENAGRRPLPMGTPTWVQIGPFEAKAITRSGNRLSVEIEIPKDSPQGILMDCHIEFEDQQEGPITVFKKNDVFRVTNLPTTKE